MVLQGNFLQINRQAFIKLNCLPNNQMTDSQPDN